MTPLGLPTTGDSPVVVPLALAAHPAIGQARARPSPGPGRAVRAAEVKASGASFRGPRRLYRARSPGAYKRFQAGRSEPQCGGRRGGRTTR